MSNNLLSSDKKYGVILADPPWTFKTYSNKGLQKSPQNHYGCMSLDDIKALPVAEHAAEDCALYMWGTYPMLPQALELIQAWGFTYKSGGAWAKQSKTGKSWQFGTGYIFRSAAEPLLVATRGKPKWLSKRERNLWVAPVREHSRKPDCIHEMIERHSNGPYLEMFARKGRTNWDLFGNQTDLFDEAA